jgi:hypothetical protein
MKIVPFYTPEVAKYFSEYGPVMTVPRGLQLYQTKLLRPDVAIPLLHLGESTALLETSILDTTDYIQMDPAPAVDGLLFRIIKEGEPDELFYQEIDETDHLSGRFRPNPDDYSVALLHTDVSIVLHRVNEDSTLAIAQIKGTFFADMATVELKGRVIIKDEDFADGVELVGYSIDTHRFNSKSKPAKHQITPTRYKKI